MLWNSLYKTGVVEIDRQNFDLMARIEEIQNSYSNKSRFEQLINFEYLVAKYFQREQTLHDEYHYCDADNHRFTHGNYLNHLRKIKRNFIERGPTLENEMIFIKDAVDSLGKHILRHDKRFAAFLSQGHGKRETAVMEKLLGGSPRPGASEIPAAY